MLYEFRCCPRCHRYGYAFEHRCPPEWEWRTDNGDEDWNVGGIFARDAEDAAKLVGEERDRNGDYSLAHGGELKVWVRQVGTEDVTVWNVTAEMTPVYSANEADDDE